MSLFLYDLKNLKSLIIHKIKTKEINTETEFGYPDETLFLVFDILRQIILLPSCLS